MNNCERSKLSGLFNGTEYIYFRPSVRRAINVLKCNVSTCIVYLNIRPMRYSAMQI